MAEFRICRSRNSVQPYSSTTFVIINSINHIQLLHHQYHIQLLHHQYHIQLLHHQYHIHSIFPPTTIIIKSCRHNVHQLSTTFNHSSQHSIIPPTTFNQSPNHIIQSIPQPHSVFPPTTIIIKSCHHNVHQLSTTFNHSSPHSIIPPTTFNQSPNHIIQGFHQPHSAIPSTIRDVGTRGYIGIYTLPGM